MNFPIKQPRTWLWLLCLIVDLAAGVGYAWATPTFDAFSWWRVGFFGLLGVAMMGLVFSWPAASSRRFEYILVIGVAVVLRLTLLPSAPSNDICSRPHLCHVPI